MIIFKQASDITEYLSSQRSSGKKTGFVPTMGALHQGHMSLLTECKKNNDLTVCSIFINPTQFNNQSDFNLYPVTLEKDIELLIRFGCDVVFIPVKDEVYPPSHHKKQYPLGEIEKILEGEFRPGHFQGVCEVVDRLLEIVQPDTLYLGQKDFQQCMVIKKLIDITNRTDSVDLRIVPTMREQDGLAMSSRNLRLSAEDRKKAVAIFETLNYVRSQFRDKDLNVIEQQAMTQLSEKGFDVDYISIRDRETLSKPADKKNLVALAAASVSGIRLIDNILLD